MSDSPLALASAEDQHALADWERAAAAVLRKARRMADADPDDSVWARLARPTLDALDGVTVPPLGTAAALEHLRTAGRPSRVGAWDVRSQVSGSRPAALNEAALTDLAGGVTSLWLQLGNGLTADDLPAVLDGVLLDIAPVVLEAPGDAGAASALLALVRGQGVTPAPGTNLGADPLTARLRTAAAGGAASGGGIEEELLPVVRLAADAGVLGVVVDASALHDLGCSEVQELGYSIAAGATYLRVLAGAGFSVDEAAALIEFRYAATDEQFLTIAKLRAARRLWARVLELSGGQHREQRQHAVTSRPMMSKYDPWVNMLRTCVAAFAAGVGGADAVTVLPFDSPLGQPDDFGRRIARNTSALLIDEAHVAQVADPAGGAYAVEQLTDDLAVAGWAELGRIEESGGVLAALADGSLLARVADTVARRDEQVAHRTRPITGLSEFPHLAESLPERQPDPGADAVRRYGAGFEALRDEPAATPVFLATLGTVAAHTARATFATNLLAAGGIAVEAAGATEDVAALVAAHVRLGSLPVVCLAGADSDYAAWGSDAVAALRAAGARWVIVAGRAEGLAADDTCAAGDDALAFLHRTREQLR